MCVTHWILQWLSQQGEEEETHCHNRTSRVHFLEQLGARVRRQHLRVLGDGDTKYFGRFHFAPAVQPSSAEVQEQPTMKSASLVPGTDDKSSERHSENVIRQDIVTSEGCLQSTGTVLTT